MKDEKNKIFILATLNNNNQMPKKIRQKVCFGCPKLAKIPNQIIYGVRLCQTCLKIVSVIYPICKTHNLPIIFISLQTYEKGCNLCMQAIKTEKFPFKMTIKQADGIVNKKKEEQYLEYINRASFLLSNDFDRFTKCFKKIFEDQYEKRRDESFSVLDQFFKDEKKFADQLQKEYDINCEGTTFEGTTRVNQMIKSFEMSAKSQRLSQIKDKPEHYRQFLSIKKTQPQQQHFGHRKVITSTCRFKSLYYSSLKYFPAETPFIDEQFQLVTEQLRDQISKVANQYISVEEKAKLKKSMKELQTKHKGEIDGLKHNVQELTKKLEKAQRSLAVLQQLEYRFDSVTQQNKELNVTIKQKNEQLSHKQQIIKSLNEKIVDLQQKHSARVKQMEQKYNEQLVRVDEKLEKVLSRNKALELRVSQLREQTKEWDKVKEKQLVKKNENRGLCKICLDRIASYVNIGCGHINICDECVKEPKYKNSCIICRKQGLYIPIFSSIIDDRD